MASQTTLLDVVFFKVPRDGELLCARLQSERLVWTHQRDDERMVAASLHQDEGDLATLLRGVQAWAAGRGLTRLSFELDGRTYTLRCATPELAAA